MIKTNYESKNYVYIASTTDKYEYITDIADTMQELANLLKIDLSAVCRMFNRHKDNENIRYFKNRKIERIKIHDYIFVVYKDNLTQPVYVSRDLNKLAKMANCHTTTLSQTLKNGGYVLKKQYLVNKVDLLDLNFEISKYLESCIDKGKIEARNYEKDSQENQL